MSKLIPLQVARLGGKLKDRWNSIMLRGDLQRSYTHPEFGGDLEVALERVRAHTNTAELLSGFDCLYLAFQKQLRYLTQMVGEPAPLSDALISRVFHCENYASLTPNRQQDLQILHESYLTGFISLTKEARDEIAQKRIKFIEENGL